MSSSTGYNLATAKTVLSAVGSIAATAMVARSVARDYLPEEFQDYLNSGIRSLLNRFTNQITMVVYEFDGLATNAIYEAAHVYLAARITTSIRRLKIAKPEKAKSISVAMEANEELVDIFNDVKFKWVFISKKTRKRQYYHHADGSLTARSDVRSLELTFHKKHKDVVLNHYLPHVLQEANARKQEERSVAIFTVDTETGFSDYPSWTSVHLDHPATFDTLAMDADVKETLLKDLKRFVNRKEYYRKIGKAWKRGYLLYGPPGTGKSSLIAAMANYLKFDIYDLELTDVKTNSELRRLLLTTGNRSILVVEDIDCSIELHDRDVAHKASPRPAKEDREGDQREASKVTLSGFLNFIDGLWSSCGDERIIIFTTNHKEKFDPALLRPGRMDVHVHMSYCTPCGFRLLVANYFGIQTHKYFEQIEELILTTEVTPAEVAEQLLKDDDPEVSLGGLIDLLHLKKRDTNEAKTKKEEVERIQKEGETGQED